MIMKKGMIFMTAMATATLIYSCSTDDGLGGGSGDPVDTTVHGTLYAASNSSNTIGAFDYMSQGILSKYLNVSSENNNGIFYNKEKDELIVASKSQKVINVFSNVKNSSNGSPLNLSLSSDAILENPIDIAVKDNVYIISDNTDLDNDPDTDEGRFFIVTRDDNGFTLRNIVTVDYAVRGIQLIGNDLYTPVDNTGDVAVLKDFIATHTTDVTVSADKRITIEGISRIHGITEDAGFVVLTDIGDESRSNDGGFNMINRFVAGFNATPDGGQLNFAGNQVRVSGSLTKLGNPVDVAYDDSRKTVYIAEQTNDGGQILFFTDVEAGGELPPTIKAPFKGASSVYFIDR